MESKKPKRSIFINEFPAIRGNNFPYFTRAATEPVLKHLRGHKKKSGIQNQSVKNMDLNYKPCRSNFTSSQ